MHPANTRRLATVIGVALLFALAAMPTLRAAGAGGTTPPSVTFGTTTVIEWDLPATVDERSGGILVDMVGGINQVWFITRIGMPRAYRLDLKAGKRVSDAQWFSWPLDAMAGPTSGLRRMKTSKDKRFIFVRSADSLQRIDTASCTTALNSSTVTCKRTEWRYDFMTPPDPGAVMINAESGSDIAVDDSNSVFTAATLANLPSDGTPVFSSVNPVPNTNFIERLNPNSSTNNVTRWYVSGGAGGPCGSDVINAASNPCLSGVAVNSSSKDLVYYAEPVGPTGGTGDGAIGELNTRTNQVRRWTFEKLNAAFQAQGDTDLVQEPRQLQFDSDGTLWAITGSGHLVSLDIRRNRMTKHALPVRFDNDLFGVAPDGGLIGYTDSSTTRNTVGMLAPARNALPVTPTSTPVDYAVFSKDATTVDVERATGTTSPSPKVIDTKRTTKEDGTFSEGTIFSGTDDSSMPLGLTPDRSASVGTFFYAVGIAGTAPMVNRIGRIRLPRVNERARVERDDDDADDDGIRADVDDDNDNDGIKNAFDADNDNDGIPDVMDDDDDNDGIEDSFDTPDHKETKQTSAQDIVAGDYALDQFTLNSGTLLAVLSATSSNPLASVSVEVLNDAGQVVASSLASPAAAVLTWTPPPTGGVFTLRVKNQSAAPCTISTKILTRELWPL